MEKEEPIRDHVASIFHVTDLHLAVPEYGFYWMPEIIARIQFGRWLSNFSTITSKVACQGRQQWTSLSTEFPDIVSAEVDRFKVEHEGDKDPPVVVAQTGDVTAFGATPMGESLTFPELSVLERLWWTRMRARGVTIVNMFGNHDVLPGRIPSIRSPRRILRVLESYSARLTAAPVLVDPLPTVVTRVDCPSDVKIEIVAINTVAMGRRLGVPRTRCPIIASSYRPARSIRRHL